MSDQTEIEYIKRILKGETNLFSYFLARYNQPVFSLIHRIILSKEDAEELTQDVFIKAFRKLDTYRGDCSFFTWIYRIAYNTAISETRKRKFIFPAIDETLVNTVKEEEIDVLFGGSEKEELLLQMEQCIENLNPEEKAMLTLYYLENKSVQELSDVFQFSTDNVKVKLHRIRKKLYVMINEKIKN